MVSSNILGPLTAKSVPFTYCLDRPLQCIATKYTLTEPPANLPSNAPTLVLAGGISLTQDTWIPFIKELFRLGSKIRSVWVVERPNHGEAGILNAQILDEHYSVIFPSLQYARALFTFLNSDLVDTFDRTNLVGIGHSGAGGSLITAVQWTQRDFQRSPLTTLILLETPLIGRETWPYFEVLYRVVKKSNARRISTWSSKEQAMKWFRSHPPWKSFHPDVLEIIEDTYFIPEPSNPSNITTKTTVKQETACFVDDGTQLDCNEYVGTMLTFLPTHLVFGSIRDLWPDGIYAASDKAVLEHQPALASVTTFEGVGHYIPVVLPEQTAAHVHSILSPSHQKCRL